MADVARCQEAIASFVQDAGEPISYRALSAQVGGTNAVRSEALVQFCKANTENVGVLQVVVARGAEAGAKSTDPRARVIKFAMATAAAVSDGTQIYGVYPSAGSAGQDDVEVVATALWAQERRVRNELFSKVQRHSPLTREARVFYESDIACAAATSRTDMGGARGEEAVSVFDSIGAAPSRPQAAAKSSFFGNTNTSKASATKATNSSSTATTAKSNGFFKQPPPSSKPKSTTTASKPLAAPETKRIDEQAMNNVLSVDSDSESGSDNDAPKFVKTSAPTKPRTKRVMISDDEDDEDEPPAKKPTAPPAKKTAAPVAQKKQESPQKGVDSVSSPPPKRKRSEEDAQDPDEPLAEDTIPLAPVKRRKEVTKTYINDLGYMTTEKVYEEVEVSVEELMAEREEARKKKAAEAAAAAQKARAAAAAQAASSSSKSSKGTAAGPPKQKKLDFFFARK